MIFLQIIPMPIPIVRNGGGDVNSEVLFKLLISICLAGLIGVILSSIIALVKTLSFEYKYISKREYFIQCLEDSCMFFISSIMIMTTIVLGLIFLIFSML